MMLQQEYNSISNKITELEERLKFYKRESSRAQSEDDEIECKYQIMKIQEELPLLHKEQSNITHEMYKLKKEQEKAEANEKIYKKYYVTLDRKMLLYLKKYFQVDGRSKDEILKAIINKYPNTYLEERMDTAINNINHFDEYNLDEVLDVLNSDRRGYLENTGLDPYRNKDSIYNIYLFDGNLDDCDEMFVIVNKILDEIKQYYVKYVNDIFR